jgi:hypothetical protein
MTARVDAPDRLETLVTRPAMVRRSPAPRAEVDRDELAELFEGMRMRQNCLRKRTSLL